MMRKCAFGTSARLDFEGGQVWTEASFTFLDFSLFFPRIFVGSITAYYIPLEYVFRFLISPLFSSSYDRGGKWASIVPGPPFLRLRGSLFVFQIGRFY